MIYFRVLNFIFDNGKFLVRVEFRSKLAHLIFLNKAGQIVFYLKQGIFIFNRENVRKIFLVVIIMRIFRRMCGETSFIFFFILFFIMILVIHISGGFDVEFNRVLVRRKDLLRLDLSLYLRRTLIFIQVLDLVIWIFVFLLVQKLKIIYKIFEFFFYNFWIRVIRRSRNI